MPIQIIKRTQPTLVESFFSGLNKGMDRGSEFGKMAYQAKLQKKKQDNEKEEKLANFAKIKNSPYWEKASDLEKAVIEGELTGGLSAQTSKSLINMQREQKEQEQMQDFLNRIQGGDPGAREESQGGESPFGQGMSPTQEEFGGGENNLMPQVEMQPSQPKDDLSKKIDYWSKMALEAPSKDIRDRAKGVLDDLRKQQDFSFRKGEAGEKRKQQKAEREYQEAKPTIEYANNLALSLENQTQDIEGMQNALKNKNFGYFTRDNLAELTGVEGFRSKEGALLKSSIKNYFLNDVKGVGGKGLNQWLEKQLSDAMLKIGRDNEANETVLSGFKARHDRDAKWLEEYRKLYKQQKGKNGVEGDIGQQVFEKVKPYYEARQRQLEAEIKTIQKSGQSLSGKMVDVIGPDGSEYEIDKSQLDQLPEGFRIR